MPMELICRPSTEECAEGRYAEGRCDEGRYAGVRGELIGKRVPKVKIVKKQKKWKNWTTQARAMGRGQVLAASTCILASGLRQLEGTLTVCCSTLVAWRA